MPPSHAELIAENAQLRAQNADLLARLDALSVQMARANERIDELLALALRKSRREPTPRSSSSPPVVDAAARAAFDARPLPPELPPKPERIPKKKTGGRKPVPEHLTTEEHVLHPEICPGCGGRTLLALDEEVEEKITAVKDHIRRRRVVRKVCRCASCRRRVTAPSLPAPYERSKFTCEFLAWLIVQKFVLLVPLDRIRELLASQGVLVSISVMVHLVQRCAELLAPIDGVHWRELLSGPWMATDATHLAVVVKGVPGTHRGYLEVFVRDDLVVMQYEPEKGGATLASKLAPFSGTLLADAEHRHNAVFAREAVIEAGCNAHGRRKLEAAETTQPSLAAEGGRFISAIYAAEAEAQAQGLTGEALREARRRHQAPVFESFRRWSDHVQSSLTPDDPLAVTLRYYTRHWDALTRYLELPFLPIDNSLCERTFQRVAKLRHACLFAGGTEGAHAMAMLMGMAATVRTLGLDPMAYFTWALERRGTHAAQWGLSARELTPAAYKLRRSQDEAQASVP